MTNRTKGIPEGKTERNEPVCIPQNQAKAQETETPGTQDVRWVSRLKEGNSLKAYVRQLNLFFSHPHLLDLR